MVWAGASSFVWEPVQAATSRAAPDGIAANNPLLGRRVLSFVPIRLLVFWIIFEIPPSLRASSGALRFFSPFFLGML
jgi:hypothetical protein